MGVGVNGTKCSVPKAKHIMDQFSLNLYDLGLEML